jgi:ABC-type transport system involved in cytochrome bd biosynthesis fused ATPase/permease subunit
VQRPLYLCRQLVAEAGARRTVQLLALALLGSALEALGLGLAAGVLLGGRGPGPALFQWGITSPPLTSPPGTGATADHGLTPGAAIALLVAVMVVRAGLQALGTIRLEALRSGFTDRLRRELLRSVVFAPATRLDQVGRGELLGLMMDDIGRSVLALDMGVRGVQAALALLIYVSGVLLVGQTQALPLLLGFAATGTAALLQRSDAWRLGQLHSRLNSALQRTVGDALHGLKAVRAAGAEGWMLERFRAETHQYRQMLLNTVGRQAIFAALRDALVVSVVGVWLLLGRGALAPQAIATTLLLAYKAAGSLGAVVTNLRLSVGALPGYGQLRQLRRQLGVPAPTDRSATAAACLPPAWSLRAIHWHERPPGQMLAGQSPRSTEALSLRRGELVVVGGPSGTGKTTLLDRWAGLLGEETSLWELEFSPGGTVRLEGQGGVRNWRSLVAYAPQEAVLFEGSLRENLLLDRSELPDGPSDQNLLHWLRRLGLGHITERPMGLDGRLNLSLDCFSGGEIQRLGLLRAWLMERPVEVLDEPTAFLDAATAAVVRQIILERARDHLVLVASHDQDLLESADRRVLQHPSDRPKASALHQPT